MELKIEADLTQTLVIRQMHELVEINIREGKRFTCLFLNREQADKVVKKLQEIIKSAACDCGAKHSDQAIYDNCCNYCLKPIK